MGRRVLRADVEHHVGGLEPGRVGRAADADAQLARAGRLAHARESATRRTRPHACRDRIGRWSPFDPDDVTWQRVSPRLAAARRLVLTVGATLVLVADRRARRPRPRPAWVLLAVPVAARRRRLGLVARRPPGRRHRATPSATTTCWSATASCSATWSSCPTAGCSTSTCEAGPVDRRFGIAQVQLHTASPGHRRARSPACRRRRPPGCATGWPGAARPGWPACDRLAAAAPACSPARRGAGRSSTLAGGDPAAAERRQRGPRRGAAGRRSSARSRSGIFGAVVLVGLGFSLLSWRMSSYSIDDEALHLRTGVLNRQQRQARLDRLQAVDVVQPLLARFIGLAELRIEVAGGKGSAVRLSYLREARGPEPAPAAAGPGGRPVRRAARAGPRGAGAPGAGRARADADREPGPLDRHAGRAARRSWRWSSSRSRPHSLGFIVPVFPAAAGSGQRAVGPVQQRLQLPGGDVAGRAAAAPRAAPDDRPDRAAGAGAGRAPGPAAAVARPGLVAGRGQRRGLQRAPARGRPARRVGQPAAAGRHPGRRARRALAGAARRRRAPDERGAGRAGRRADRQRATPAASRPARAPARLLDPISWRRHGFRVTEQRLLARRGVFTRELDVVPHERTQSLGSSRGRCSGGSGWCRSCCDSTPGPVHPRVEHLAGGGGGPADGRPGRPGPGPPGPGRSTSGGCSGPPGPVSRPGRCPAGPAARQSS